MASAERCPAASISVLQILCCKEGCRGSGVEGRVSISRLVSSGAANKIEIAAADNYLSLRDH
jgi:hypothetical protein